MKVDYLRLVREYAGYIEEHIGEPFHAEQLAASGHYSYPHFARIFSDIVGLSPLHYAMRRKLSCAARELLESAREIVEIAIVFGYDSQQTFTRAFANLFGMPPLQYRKRGIPDGMTLPFAFLEGEPSPLQEVEIMYLPPMAVASYAFTAKVLPRNREIQWEKIIGKAFTGLVLWQMAMFFRRMNGINAPLPSVGEQGHLFVERGLHLPPNTRYFGYIHPYPCSGEDFGYAALCQVPEMTRQEREDALKEGIAFHALPGGMYARLPAAYGTGSDLNLKWKALHDWLASAPEYDYGDGSWLEEHVTLPGKGGFHGFQLYMPIREATK